VLLAHGQLVVHQDPQVTFCKVTFQLVSMPGVIHPLVKDFAFTMTEHHKVTVGPFLQLVEVSLNESTDIWCTRLSFLFYMICKLAEGALCPIITQVNVELLVKLRFCI